MAINCINPRHIEPSRTEAYSKRKKKKGEKEVHELSSPINGINGIFLN